MILKRAILVLIAGVILCAIIGVSWFLIVLQPAQIKITYFDVAIHAFQFYAIEHGRIDANIVKVSKNVDAVAVSQALQSGTIDAAAFASMSAVLLRERGAPVKIETFMGCVKGNDSVIAVKADSPINSLKDLEGRRVGIPSPYSSMVVAAKILLNKVYGVDLGKIEWIVKPSPEILTLLYIGDVDAGILLDDFGVRAISDPDYKVILDIGLAWHDTYGFWLMVACLAVNENFIRNRSEDLRKMLGTLNSSIEYASTHYEEVVSSIADERLMDVGLLKELYDTWIPDLAIDEQDMQHFMLYVQLATEIGVLEKETSVEEIFHVETT